MNITDSIDAPFSPYIAIIISFLAVQSYIKIDSFVTYNTKYS